MDWKDRFINLCINDVNRQIGRIGLTHELMM